MHSSDLQSHSRRAFLRRSGQLALTGTALPFALNLAAMGEAAAFNATSGDYKALVCVFMFGGNDYGNTVIPYDDVSYDKYHAIRGGGATGRGAAGIAIAQSALTPTLLAPTTAPLDVLGQPRQYALHPAMTGLAGLFNAGKAAVQLNVGPLVKPTTRTQFNSSNRALYPLPPQLFSHNDQQSIWQSSRPEGSKIGWGGNMGDLVVPPNPSLNSNALFTGISVAGNAVFLSGDTALQYQVSTGGAIKIRPATDTTVYGSSTVRSTLNALIQQTTSTNKLENDYNTVTKRALDSEAAITSALALTSGASAPAWVAAFDTTNNYLAQQLKMVARLIHGRTQLGNRRQVFFVSIGGFDLHDGLIAQHPTILGQVSDAMTRFYNATDAMGVASQVTSFTASDFGRTLASNGDGSDHGWGSHHLVVGGAVNGKAFYGTPPPVNITDGTVVGGVRTYSAEEQWHVGQGRLLPSTSVDQYAATMAKWFGVDASEMAGVLPNIANFGGAGYPVDLGFMAA
jgi:uncharacterized protein (DUF1501 family)